MHGRREKNAQTSAGSVPWVCARIVEAAASRDIRPWVVPPPRFRGGFGQNGAPEPALFLDVTVPVPFSCVAGFWIAGLIDELNRPIPLSESTTSLVYDSRAEMTVTLRALRQ